MATRRLLLLPVALAAALAAAPAAAQSPGWSVAPALFIDPELVSGTGAGPGLVATAEVRPHQRVSYELLLAGARVDFSSLGQDYHKVYGVAAVGPVVNFGASGGTVSLSLGGGVLGERETVEADPDLRGGSNAEELLVLGVRARWPLAGRWRIQLSAHDLIGGWWLEFLDSEEGRIAHRWMVSVGVAYR